MDDMKAQGADGFVWSVGSEVPINSLASSLSAKYELDTLASMGHGATPSSGAIVDTLGDAYDYTDYKVNVTGYTGKAILRTSVLTDKELAFL